VQVQNMFKEIVDLRNMMLDLQTEIR